MPPTLAGEGTAVFNGIDLVHAPAEQMRQLRGSKIAMVLQQPMTAFDPLYTMGAQFRETLTAHGAYTAGQADDLAVTMFGRVRLDAPQEVLRSYPHELSGGMLQRCMIALALALEPQIIVADEPTTALDAETQFEVVQRFLELRAQCNTAMIFVSHDLGVVQRLADAVLVMKDGRCVEYGPAETVFNAPQHEYTQYLIRTRLALTRGFEAMGESTGGATIFGVSGGVMEAALRYAYQAVTGKRPESWDFKQVRGLKGLKEYTVTVNGIELHLAVVHGAKRFAQVCDEVRAGKSPYHFIEFMACPGGCVCGGGQPIMIGAPPVAGFVTKWKLLVGAMEMPAHSMAELRPSGPTLRCKARGASSITGCGTTSYAGESRQPDRPF